MFLPRKKLIGLVFATEKANGPCFATGKANGPVFATEKGKGLVFATEKAKGHVFATEKAKGLVFPRKKLKDLAGLGLEPGLEAEDLPGGRGLGRPCARPLGNWATVRVAGWAGVPFFLKIQKEML